MTKSQAEISSYALHNCKGQILSIKQRWEALDSDSRSMLQPYMDELNDAMASITKVVFALDKTIIPIIDQLEKKNLGIMISHQQGTKIYNASERT